MRRMVREVALWLALAVGAIASVRAAVAPFVRTDRTGSAVLKATEPAAPSYPADSLAGSIVARDLFRLGRRPAPTRYDPNRESSRAPLAPNKPQLVLRGLTLGDTARALLEGLPGIEGSRLVRAGDIFGGLRIAGISRTQVRVTGLDTVWVLRLRRQS